MPLSLAILLNLVLAMWHDEPANRPGQDQNASLPVSQWESRYLEQIAHYQALVFRFPDKQSFKNQLAKYEGWLVELKTSASMQTDDRLPF